MAVNAWGEPLPVRLTGALGAAWSHMYMDHEGFDGEDGIAYGYQQRLISDWNANRPATVTIHDWRTGNVAHRSFATLREAYAYAVNFGEGATVNPAR